MCKSASHSKYPSTVNCKFWPGSIQVNVFKFSATSSFSKSCKLRSLLLKWAKKVNHYIVFMLFSYLCYRCFNHPANMISLDDIARDVHVTISTVKKYSSALVNTGHVSADLSLISNLQCGKTKIFSHYPTESFCWNSHLLHLWPTLICCWSKIATHTCHPSYNTIATATGMSKNTALKKSVSFWEWDSLLWSQAAILISAEWSRKVTISIRSCPSIQQWVFSTSGNSKNWSWMLPDLVSQHITWTAATDGKGPLSFPLNQSRVPCDCAWRCLFQRWT